MSTTPVQEIQAAALSPQNQEVRQNESFLSKYAIFRPFVGHSEESKLEIKQKLGISGSNLNRTQLMKIADIQKCVFNPDAVRMRNLDRTLTKTEYSLSFGAHDISKRKGTEDRYFHAEGCKLSKSLVGATTAEMLQAKQTLTQSIANEVKSTHKYTLQRGNSLSSIDRRAYMIDGILRFARQSGLSAQFLEAAIQERKNNPDTAKANEQFIETLKAGVENDVLSLDDSNLPAVLEDVGVEVLEQIENFNRSQGGMFRTPIDASQSLNQLGRAFQEAGILPNNDVARFVHNVQSRRDSQEGPTVIQKPTAPVETVETQAEEKARLKAEKARLKEEAIREADLQLQPYLQNRQELKQAQERLLEAQGLLKTLLKSNAKNDLSDLSGRDKDRIIMASRATGLPVAGDFSKQGLAESIERQKALVAQLSMAVDQTRTAYEKPTNYKLATSTLRAEVRSVEAEVKANDVKIQHEIERLAVWEKESNAVNEKIAKKAEEGIELALGKPTEEVLPDFVEVKEKKAGFFAQAKERAAKFFDRNRPTESTLPEFEEVVSTDGLEALDVEALPEPKSTFRFWR